MKKIPGYRHSYSIIFLITLSVFFLTQCVNNGNDEIKTEEENTNISETRNINFQQFAGSATCADCHKKIYESHIKTGHYLTSRPALEKYIKGSFDTGKNIYPFHPGLYVAMEERDSGLYQVAYSEGIEKAARRFDIIMGSGAKGQTFLSWKGNQLFQLPITYFTPADEWCNSPGFPNKVIFNRPATSRCLECHTTYANVISKPGTEPEEYDRSKIIYGVDCEKCHGPAANHVAYEIQNPADSVGKYIINPGKLNRQQILDLCALCHGGRLNKTKPSFEFTAGNYLANYFVKDTSISVAKIIDVHGNQYGLLQESKCFKNSATLTCISCHSTHENERGNTTVFSQRCMSCHSIEHNNFCKIKNVPLSALKLNCIDCHMPREPSMSVAVVLPGATVPTPALIHTHLIKTYPEQVKKVLALMKKN